MEEYEILYADINYINKKVIIISWGVIGIGFGELVISNETFEIIDSEGMSNKFCKAIIEQSAVSSEIIEYRE